jgi:hypothetical protein
MKNLPNLSMVAFYGEKIPELESLIQEIQSLIASLVGNKFKSYRLE